MTLHRPPAVCRVGTGAEGSSWTPDEATVGRAGRCRAGSPRPSFGASLCEGWADGYNGGGERKTNPGRPRDLS